MLHSFSAVHALPVRAHPRRVCGAVGTSTTTTTAGTAATTAGTSTGACGRPTNVIGGSSGLGIWVPRQLELASVFQVCDEGAP